MKYILGGLLAVAMLAGCGSSYRAGKPHEVLLNADMSISIQLPEQNGWTVFQDSVIAEKERISQPYLYDPSSRFGPNIIAQIFISRYLSQSTMDFRIYDYPSRKSDGETMLDRSVLEALEEEQKKLPNAWQIKNDQETRAFGRKYWVDYIHGMKCASVTFSRGEGGTWLPGAKSKFYKTYCAYYDLEAKPRVFSASAFYFYHPGSTATVKEDGQEKKIRMTQEMVENEYKFTMAQLLDSLQVKTFNAQMMKEQGLLYDRKYEIPVW